MIMMMYLIVMRILTMVHHVILMVIMMQYAYGDGVGDILNSRAINFHNLLIKIFDSKKFKVQSSEVILRNITSPAVRKSCRRRYSFL